MRRPKRGTPLPPAHRWPRWFRRWNTLAEALACAPVRERTIVVRWTTERERPAYRYTLSSIILHDMPASAAVIAGWRGVAREVASGG